jgi:hypothetical protein
VNTTASDVIAAIAIIATIVTTSSVAWIGHLDRKGDHEHERTLDVRHGPRNGGRARTGRCSS